MVGKVLIVFFVLLISCLLLMTVSSPETMQGIRNFLWKLEQGEYQGTINGIFCLGSLGILFLFALIILMNSPGKRYASDNYVDEGDGEPLPYLPVLPAGPQQQPKPFRPFLTDVIEGEVVGEPKQIETTKELERRLLNPEKKGIKVNRPWE